MSSFIALYDACVLYPAPLRDLLMHLAMSELFLARWTDQIHDEWIRSVLSQRPDLKREQLERTRQLMNAHVFDCLVTGYGGIIADLVLPDPDDRHILAAAVHAGAEVIVTYNLADFPAVSLEPYGIVAVHPDSFICHLLDLDASAVCAAAKRQRESLKRPAKTVEEFLECLAQQRIPQTIARLREFQELL